MPLRSGLRFPGLSLFCIFGLYWFGFLPCFLSCSSGVLRPGCSFPLGGLLLYGCIGSLIPRWSAVVLSSVVCLQSSFATFVVVLFIPPSSFRPPSVSVGCDPSAFAMGSPWLGSSVGVVSSTRSERRLSFLVSLVFLRDGVTLWVKCVFLFPLDLDRRITLAFGFCSLRWAPGSGAFAYHLFPWVGFIVCLCAPLLFSVWLPSAL